jgi:hypothetical protein
LPSVPIVIASLYACGVVEGDTYVKENNLPDSDGIEDKPNQTFLLASQLNLFREVELMSPVRRYLGTSRQNSPSGSYMGFLRHDH